MTQENPQIDFRTGKVDYLQPVEIFKAPYFEFKLKYESRRLLFPVKTFLHGNITDVLTLMNRFG